MKYAIFALLAVLVVFAACESQVESETEIETEAQIQPENQTGTTHDIVDDVVGTVDDAREELLAFFDRLQNLRYSVDYTITAQGQAATMSQYVDTNAMRIRVDTEAQGIKTRVIIDGEDVYSCMNMGSWSCFEASNDDAEMIDTTSADARGEFMIDSSIPVTRVADRMVAGTNTQCYVFDAGDGESEQCFSPEGFPLYIETITEGQATVLQATSYSLSIPNNAFELPAQPGSVNDFGGGFDASAWGY